jgi:ribosomal-protein-alanine N-acetyltransferase
MTAFVELKGKVAAILWRWSLTKGLRNRTRRFGSPGEESQWATMRVLETERLLLREFCQADLNDLVTWEGPSGEEFTEAQARRFLNFCFAEYFKLGVGRWGMLLKSTGGVVGNCGFCYINFKQKIGEVAYYIAPKYRGRGLAAEALGALIQFGFADIGLARIQARCGPDNTSSERVMQKAGMIFERMVLSREASKSGSRTDKMYAVVSCDFKTYSKTGIPPGA